MHMVQAYVETRPRRSTTELNSSSESLAVGSKKRKSPNLDYLAPGDSISSGGLLTPQDSHAERSRSQSIVSIDSSSELAEEQEPSIYNGILSKREGHLLAKSSEPHAIIHARTHHATIDARTLPTPAMLQVAARTPLAATERLIQQAFIEKLKPLPNLDLENNIDSSTPSLNFTFITNYILGEGVMAADKETNVGCAQCRPDMGQGIGCEYTQKCDCLEYAAVDETALSRNPEEYKKYLAVKANGGEMKASWPKRFPYSKPGRFPQTLASHYRETRNPIYECNENCRCGPRCKSRLVQKGRKVPLTIFKTKNRGWGVKSSEELIKGEFIDTYLGEVITNEEADRRGDSAGLEKDSYLYNLDKFVGDPFDERLLEPEDCYVVDGQHMGGPTRFINHSCEPNCRQYTVSYNKYDLRLFTLAFFAYEDIPAGRELTFDYLDQDEQEEDAAIRKREEALLDPENVDKVKCNCGSTKCRGILWS